MPTLASAVKYMALWEKKRRKSICVLCIIHTSRNPIWRSTVRSWKCKTDASISASTVTEWDGRICQANRHYQKGGELWGYCSQLAQSSGKGVRLIRAGYLCRLPSPPDCHSILDVKNRQKLIIASVFKDAHTCSLQTRERGKKSILSGQVSVLSLSYLHTPTNLPMWEQDYRCTVCRVNSSSPLWELIRRDAWIALFSQAHGVQPIFISSLKEGKAETS